MSPLMTVGEFALATGLSAKALRFYDERGLLAPADVDAHSGYRRYEPGQIRTAAQIRVLRAAGLTVDDVRSVLADPASASAWNSAAKAAFARSAVASSPVSSRATRCTTPAHGVGPTVRSATGPGRAGAPSSSGSGAA